MLPGNGLCLETDGPPTLARDSRLGALSDEAGPQPASPARSIRLTSSPRRGHSRHRHGRNGRMSSGLSGGAVDRESVTVHTRVTIDRIFLVKRNHLTRCDNHERTGTSDIDIGIELSGPSHVSTAMRMFPAKVQDRDHSSRS